MNKDPYDGIEKLAASLKTAAKTVYAGLSILKESGGELSVKELMDQIPHRVPFSEWEMASYEKTGQMRWKGIFHFYSIDCVKAGFLRKNHGIWYITPEGEQALEAGAVELLNQARKKYNQWEQSRSDPSEEPPPEKEQEATLEQMEENALSGIRTFISGKNPYEFQDLVGALLRAMGYYTPFIAPKGKDGGVDILAYKDPLGTIPPRIKVQVKHKPDSAIAVDEIRRLMGLLNKNGDVGLFVTSGRFTSDAERESRSSHVHVKLIDGDQLIDLWKDHYHKLPDEEKKLLPLEPVFFLGASR
ncbi:MAG TPA: Mrr restriction system protein [Thermotogota bacterium]|nr:Mrr restriction system protein [Thermotogota bacterium]HRW93397.1 Mrr restriction system protein [Thermotogota bacterium]